MGKKRSSRARGGGGSSSGGGNASSSTSATAAAAGESAVPSHLLHRTFAHPTGVPLRHSVDFAAGDAGANAVAGGAMGGGVMGGAGAMGATPADLERLAQLSSLTPAMLQQLLSMPGAAGGGPDPAFAPGVSASTAGASGSTLTGGAAMGGGTLHLGGSINFGGTEPMSPADAAAAQRYLQSISQALASQLSASGTTPPAPAAAAGGNNNAKVFGPPPPPPPAASMSATLTASTGTTLTVDLDPTSSSQNLGMQLEALSQLMLAQKNSASTILKHGHAAIDKSSASEAKKREALEALDRLGQSTADHMQNFQQLMSLMGQGHRAALAGGGMATLDSHSGTGGGGSGGSDNNNSTTNMDDPSVLPAFHDLVALTNDIVAAQDAGDADAVDAATSHLCERVMSDSAAMGVLGVAMSHPGGMAGMQSLFQSAMSESGRGGSGEDAARRALLMGMLGANGAHGTNTAGPTTSGSGVAVPPLPPPAGGWPPSSAPAAAAAAAMAAFATNPTPNGPAPPDADASDEAGAQAWLDYYDACLRAGGVRGGLTEFEEYARLGTQNGGSAGMAAAAFSGGRPPPQDRPLPRTGKDDGDCPAEFEYDDHQSAAEDDINGGLTEEELRQLAEEEEEKRKKKAAKKRDKKARQKERAKKEAEAKAARAAAKKREKAITSWRSRIVQACGAGDGKKMDALVGESPYRNYTYDPATTAVENDDENDNDNDEEGDRPKTHEEYLVRQLEWFLPNCLQKYPSPSGRAGKRPFPPNPARERFAKHVFATAFDVALLQSPVKSRNAIHWAAYHNDVDLLRWIVDVGREQNRSREERRGYLEAWCEDAGWTPLHYSLAGGAADALEFLLGEGADVLKTTDRSLTCLNRYGRRGNGICAQDLAIVLQSGAVDDDLSSNADILDEVVETRIENVSADDKAAYMKILRALEDRLGHVADNGYSPPEEKQQQQAQDASQSQTSGNDAAVEQSAASSSNNKKSKKKKKKQQQQANASKASSAPTDTSTSEPESKQIVGDEGDLSDPVAVALLGMGFTEDQILSAARALGGFDRATADDMVMWILGGGEITDSGGDASAPEPTTYNDNPNSDADNKRSDSEVLSKAQKKAAAKAKREAEELARKKREELAAAERAAAKREEQRRIRREWNEREQARQAEEKKLKAAQAVERRRRAEMEKLMPKAGVLPAATGVVPPMSALHVPPAGGGGGKHLHHHPGHHQGGPPLTIIAGGPKPTAKPKPGSNMGIPQAPNVRAPKILTRPNNAPPGTLMPGGAPAQPSTGSQPLFMQSGSSSPPRVNASAKAYKPSSHHHQHYPQPTAILQKNSGVAGLHHPQVMTRGHPSPGGAQADYHRHHHSSSFGHSPHVSDGGGPTSIYQNHPSQQSSVPPPGFQPGQSQQVSAAEPPVETNPMGTIRATAREFVPTFQMKSTSREFVPTQESNAVPSMSAQPATVQLDAVQPTTVSPPPPTRTSSNDNSADQLVEPMSSLLSSFGRDNDTPPATSVPIKGHDSTVPSAASSITGLSGLQPTPGEDNLTSRVGSVMTFESSTSGGGAAGGMQTTSILESIACGDQNVPTAVPSLGSGVGIWGGANTVNQGSSTLGGLAGLNFTSFMGDQPKNSNEGNNPGGSTWGANAGGSGSIW